ncbi:SH3 domain-containing protein, partial [uncultured Clostridium sp.]|uniref:SH3 domain-containing protein n=1 Tax=uncultured Clostridium sp. TaxID=59620 RepID=UPI002623F794
SKVVGTITDGTEVIIVDSAEGFYQIINGDSMVWAPENRVFPMYQIGYISYPQIGYTDIMSESTWDSNCIGTINDGAKVIIINNEYCFYEIINGTSTGWVAGNRVTTTPPQVNPSQENIFEPLNKVGYVLFSDFSNTDIMNSYTWDTGVAGTLENGTTINIKGKQNGWYQIEFNGSVAWIICNRVYIPEPFIQVAGVITKEGKIQRIPSMNSIQNVGICDKGSKVTIISKINGWYQILNSNNTTSWIPTANIQLLIFSKE